jgi:putative hydrolase of the HAD superfamily
MRGLVVDWGGVLTGGLAEATRAWAKADDIDLEVYTTIIRDWLGEPFAVAAQANPIHALERGEIVLPDFERKLAVELTRRTGTAVVGEGLLTRMFAQFEHAPDMNGLVHRARLLGITTGLLSNSWGNDYPRDAWDEMFDVIVISGEVGMRKPEPRIFQHTLELLKLPAEQCVFVDDVRHNVEASAALGMVGVHHTSYEQTLLELQTLFARDLS